MDVLDDGIDVETQHPVNACGIGVDHISSNVAARIGLEEQFCAQEKQTAAQSPGGEVHQLMELDAARTPAGADGLVFLPYLMGEQYCSIYHALKPSMHALSDERHCQDRAAIEAPHKPACAAPSVIS